MEGRGKGCGWRLGPGVWLTLLAAAVILLAVREGFTGGKVSTDVFTYWDFARNALRGNGWVGNTLFSTDLWARGFLPAPMEPGRLLHPCLMALALGFAGGWLQAAVFVSALATAASVPLVFWLARRWFGLEEACLAAFFFIFSRDAIEYALWGCSDPLFTALLLLAMGVLSGARTRGGYWAAGLLLGLCAVTRPVGLAYAAPAAAYAWMRDPKNRLSHLLAVLLPVWAAGEAVRWINVLVCHAAPLCQAGVPGLGAQRLLFHTRVFPDLTSLRYLALPDAPLALITHAGPARTAFFEKVFSNWAQVPSTLLPYVCGGWAMGGCALLGLLLARARTETGPLRTWFAGCLLLQVCALSLTVYKERYLFPLSPYALIWAAAFIVRAGGLVAARLPRRLFYGACAAALVLPLPVGGSLTGGGIKALVRPVETNQGKTGTRAECFGGFADAVLPPGRPYLAGAWYGRVLDAYSGGTRLVGSFPRTLAMMRRLADEKTDVDAWVVTSADDRPWELPEWMYFLWHPQPYLGFVPHLYRDGGFRAVIYVRNREREALRLYREACGASGEAPRALRLLGCALAVDPRCRPAARLLEKTRVEAAERGAALREQAGRENAAGRLPEAFQLLLQAGALGDGVRLFAGLKDGLMEHGLASLVRYTANPACKLETTLSGYPCAPVFTDGLIDRPRNVFDGLEARIHVDLDGCREVDRVVLYTDLTRARIARVQVESSVDARHWAPVRRWEPVEASGGLYRLELQGLNVVCPHLRVSVEGDGMRPVRVDEMEIWGLAPAAGLAAAPGLDPAHVVFRHGVAQLHRRTGGAVQDGETGGALEAAPGRDKPGFLAFGGKQPVMPGRYRVGFRLKSGGCPPQTPVGWVDVTADSGRRVLARKTLYGKDFPDSGRWTMVEVPFDVADGQWVEPRVFFSGASSLATTGWEIEGDRTVRTRVSDSDGAGRP